VHELSWFFEGSRWGDLVLKESHSSPAVRHAVIALSATHEDFKDNLTTAAQAPQYSFAATNYGQSIRHLIKETGDDAQASRMRALMCGLLFISIDILRGNNSAAARHLDGCLKIVKEAQLRMGMLTEPCEPLLLKNVTSEPEAHMAESIIPMYARLDVHSSVVFGQNPQGESVWDPTIRVQIEEPPSTSFETVTQACNSLLLISNRNHR